VAGDHPGPPTMRRRTRFRLTAAFILAATAAWAGAAYLALPEFWTLRERHRPRPAMLTTTPQGIPGDPINVGVVGTLDELVLAFAEAGWRKAEALGFRSDIGIGESVVFDRPDPEAPVSTLIFQGRRQDLAFEKPVGTSADRRHHVRFWLAEGQGIGGRPLWLGAASFDKGVGFSRDTGQITHHVDADLDAERDLVIDDLGAAGLLSSTSLMDGIGPTDDGRNGGGDRYFTDGKILVGTLRPAM
jgi:hypothetical protein